MTPQNSSEFVQITLASFDPKCRSFAFLRTFPVAVYVAAGDESSQVGRGLSEIVGVILSELDFEIQEVRTEVGSFCQLNICQSRVPLDEPSLHEKIEHAHRAVSQRLAKFPIRQTANIAGSAAVAVVAIGTAVQLMQASNPETVAIGRFILPASVWVPLLVAKETRDFLTEVREILVKSKAARKALREAKEPPAKIKLSDNEVSLPQWSAKRITDREDRIRRLEATLRQAQEELEKLKNE
jgi:hypothetical protein